MGTWFYNAGIYTQHKTDRSKFCVADCLWIWHPLESICLPCLLFRMRKMILMQFICSLMESYYEKLQNHEYQ